MILAKHHNGPTKTVTVAGQLHLSRFTEHGALVVVVAEDATKVRESVEPDYLAADAAAAPAWPAILPIVGVTGAIVRATRMSFSLRSPLSLE